MRTLSLVWTTAALLGHGVALGALNIPSDGSDGALVITNDTVIDLSQAVTGKWDTNNTVHAGKGVYDAAKWAVVFKYSSVTVNTGATVTFKNHASRAPLVWLVQGNVTINGGVSLDGQNGIQAPWLAEPGPGGFRGGTGYSRFGDASAGFGIGGGHRSIWGGSPGGSYGSRGENGPASYGNPSLIPLLGGSGGSGRWGRWEDGGHCGGGGAGAILIACAQTVTISGSLHADGGDAHNNGAYAAGGGSGGGVRLVASTIEGNGGIQALGGRGLDSAGNGGVGRVRIERVTNNSTLLIIPDPSVVTLAGGVTPQLWMPDDGPVVKIISIGGQVPPADPRAEFAAAGPDIAVPEAAVVPVIVETTNVEQASVVTVRRTARISDDCTEMTATLDHVVREDPLVIRWKAEVPVNGGYSALQVKVVRP